MRMEEAQIAYGQPAFEFDKPFEWRQWWVGLHSESDRCYHWLNEDGEVVRAHLILGFDFDTPLKEVGQIQDCVYLVSFEVRLDKRRQGFGQAALRSLENYFTAKTLIALPMLDPETMGFWRNTSWRHYERVGGDEGCRPVFVRFP